MNLGVMFSIQAQHTAKIFELIGYENKKIEFKDGVTILRKERVPVYKKTLEVRKTRPKLQTPFKGFIYETKGVQVVHLDGCDVTYRGRGKVIGEFICDHIYECADIAGRCFLELNGSCLSLEELDAYSGGKTLYGIHITELVLYKTPKSLREFRKPCDGKNGYCSFNGRVCKHRDIINNKCNARLTTAPQSWGYVAI